MDGPYSLQMEISELRAALAEVRQELAALQERMGEIERDRFLEREWRLEQRERE